MPTRIVPTKLEIESVGSNSGNNIQIKSESSRKPSSNNKLKKSLVLPKETNKGNEDETIDLFEKPLSTGRSRVVDCFMSVWMIFIVLSISQLFLTCLIIWVSSAIVLNQGLLVDMSAISIISWVTFAVMSVVSIICLSIAHNVSIKRPLKQITLHLFKMKKIKFDDIERMPTLLTEFIPFFSLFWEFTKTMKEIRPFIPESLLPIEDEIEERIAQEHREQQLIEMRKLITQRKQVSKTSLLSSYVDKSSLGVLSQAPSRVSAIASATTGAHQKVSMELGLTSYVATVLVIQFRNFDGRSYPIATDLLGVFTMLYQKVQNVSRQFKGRATIITPKIIMVSFENGRNFEKGALMCSVQLKKQMQAVNSQLRDQVKLPELDYGIGISRSECLVGNIGTSQVKYFSLIGECSSNALKLASLNAMMGTRILTDESMTNALLSDFISRPVHFSKRNSVLGNDIAFDLDGKTTQTIIELIGEDRVDDDEWLYELQQKEDSQRFVNFENAFEMLRSSTLNKELLQKSIEIIQEYVDKDQRDTVSLILHDHLSSLLTLNDTDLRERMKTFCLEDFKIDLKIDPTFVL